MEGPDEKQGNRTIYVGGLAQGIDEQQLYDTFSTFGDIVDLQLPRDNSIKRNTNASSSDQQQQQQQQQITAGQDLHRGFAFVQYAQQSDAFDAIDNMHQNELRGSVLSVNLSKPQKPSQQRASNRAVWQDESWLRQHASVPEKMGVDTETSATEA